MQIRTLLQDTTSVRDGAMWCTNTFDAATKGALIAAADRVILLVDSPKLDITHVMKVADVPDIHRTVTGVPPTTQASRMLGGARVEPVTVKLAEG
jgi:DeoR/GlpR family transcriptional regulator of sugar metabolism